MFNTVDIKTVKWWEKLILWFKPTFVSIDKVDGGEVTTYLKIWKGNYYIIRVDGTYYI